MRRDGSVFDPSAHRLQGACRNEQAGFVYDRIIYPLFTRPFYDDKNRQEQLIRQPSRDWVLVRPAVFKATAGSSPLRALVEIRPSTVLRRVTRDEVTAFVLDQLADDRDLRKAVFLGHAS